MHSTKAGAGRLRATAARCVAVLAAAVAAAVPVALVAEPAHAATGDIVGQVTFGQDCASGIGTGVTFDGSALWYTCYASPTDLLRADPHTGAVLASYHIAGGLGSFSRPTHLRCRRRVEFPRIAP